MFKKYHSIENSYRTEFINRIQGHMFWNETFIVQEKAHGTNLSFWTINGEDFQVAKRSATLEANEAFYNAHEILATHKTALTNIWKQLKVTHPDLEQLTIYGELIGGHYPHENVTRDKTAIKVQKGVYYCPQNTFYAFDILINKSTYIDVASANELFKQEEMLHATTLFEGTLEDCLAYTNTFDSTIPASLGLPPLSPNTVEGTIIKPAQPLYFNNGTRVILKNKNEQWSEKIKGPKRVKVEAPLPEKIVQLQEEIALYITENRLNNVLSKIGEITMKDMGRVMGMFNKDIIEDFLKDNNHLITDLEKKELKLVTKSIVKKTGPMVKAKVLC